MPVWVLEWGSCSSSPENAGGNRVMGQYNLAGVSQLRQSLGPNCTEPCFKLEKEPAHCLKSLQAMTADNKYVCMDVKRINCLWSALDVGKSKQCWRGNQLPVMDMSLVCFSVLHLDYKQHLPICEIHV